MKENRLYNKNLAFINKEAKGNLVLDGKFVFADKSDKLPMLQFIKWITQRNPQKKEKKNDAFIPEVIHSTEFLNTKNDVIAWIGHSTFFIQLNGIRILTDPIFYNITPMLKRRHARPCSITVIQNIDYILLSHGHRDHLDNASLRMLLKRNPNVEILCPLGFKKMLQKIGFNRIQEAAWWQQYQTKKITIDFLPAKHWNRRFVNDYNTTLWGSFAIYTENKSIYFAGDTGYSTHFKAIHKHYAAFDTCLMPVGAYKPRYIMEWAHTSPDEAVDAFNELNGKTFIPMHYGTFDLSDEPASEPVKMLHQLEKEEKINGKLQILKVGEIHSI